MGSLHLLQIVLRGGVGPSGLDRLDGHAREELAMPHALSGILSPPQIRHDELGAAGLPQHLSNHLRSRHQWLPDRWSAPILRQVEDLAELDPAARLELL